MLRSLNMSIAIRVIIDAGYGDYRIIYVEK